MPRTVMSAGQVNVPEALLIVTAGKLLWYMASAPIMVWLPVPTIFIVAFPPPLVAVLVRLRLPNKLIMPVLSVILLAPLMPIFPLTPRIVAAAMVMVYVPPPSKTTLFKLWLPVMVSVLPNTTVELLVVTSNVPAI